MSAGMTCTLTVTFHPLLNDDIDDVFIKPNILCQGVKKRPLVGIEKKLQLTQYNPFGVELYGFSVKHQP